MVDNGFTFLLLQAIFSAQVRLVLVLWALLQADDDVLDLVLCVIAVDSTLKPLWRSLLRTRYHRMARRYWSVRPVN